MKLKFPFKKIRDTACSSHFRWFFPVIFASFYSFKLKLLGLLIHEILKWTYLSTIRYRYSNDRILLYSWLQTKKPNILVGEKEHFLAIPPPPLKRHNSWEGNVHLDLAVRVWHTGLTVQCPSCGCDSHHSDSKTTTPVSPERIRLTSVSGALEAV